MNAQTTPQTTPTSAPTLTADLVAKLASAYTDSNTTLTRRALAVHAAVTFGADVKSIARDMADANRADASIPAVKAAVLGYARFAGTVAEMTGNSLVTWAKREPEMVADVIRAVKRVGIKTMTAELRTALHGVDGPVHREQVAGEVTARMLAKILPAATAQGPRSAAGESLASDADATGEVTEHVTGVHTGSDVADVLATVRALTGWFQRGGTWSPDLASALSQLADAATAARKRTAPAVTLPAQSAPVAA